MPELQRSPVRVIAFAIPGEPVPQGRPRVAVVHGFARVYQPAKSTRWQEQVRLFAIDGMQPDGEPIAGPVRLDVAFFLARPGRLCWKSRPMPETWAPNMPDLDNLVKAVLDGINKIAILDDRQIVQLAARKMYCAGPGYGEQMPRVEVTLRELTDDVQQGCLGRGAVRSATRSQGELL